jgi:hypothetical protein
MKRVGNEQDIRKKKGDREWEHDGGNFAKSFRRAPHAKK